MSLLVGVLFHLFPLVLELDHSLLLRHNLVQPLKLQFLGRAGASGCLHFLKTLSLFLGLPLNVLVLPGLGTLLTDLELDF